MIVLHEHKLIFLKSIKTAGTSFEIALSKYANKKDIITNISPNDEEKRKNLGYTTAQNCGIDLRRTLKNNSTKSILKGGFCRKFYNHMPAREAKEQLGNSIWESYTKVSIVRNPFDSAVSLYFWQNRGNRAPPSFLEWVTKNHRKLRRNRAIYTLNGKNAIDFYIRFESLIEDTKLLEKKIPALEGLASELSKINAKSGIRPKNAAPRELFQGDEKAQEAVRQACDFEFKKFGYTLS